MEFVFDIGRDRISIRWVEIMEYNIKDAINKSNLTVREISEMLGIPERTINHWVKVDRKPATWAERMIVDILKRTTEIQTQNRSLQDSENIKVGLSMYLEIDPSDIDKIMVLKHHIEYLLDLDNWPEIKSVSEVDIIEPGINF